MEQPDTINVFHVIIAIGGGMVATLQGLLVYIWKSHVHRTAELEEIVQEHIKLCGETPNSTILAAIASSSKVNDERHNQTINQLNAINGELVNVRVKTAALEATVAKTHHSL